MNKFICILPLGEVGLVFFKKLKEDLEGGFDFEVKLEDKIEIPDYAYDESRDQCDSRIILNELKTKKFIGAERVVAVTDVDLFTKNLNYIFGRAESSGKICLVSVKRLDPAFYKQKVVEDLFYNRVLKEVIHELGHTFGLKHCKNEKCVMYFSNTVEDTDNKGVEFCEECQKAYEYMKS